MQSTDSCFDPPVQTDPEREAVDAVYELYERYSDALYRVAYRLTGSQADAEDVLQDLFVGLPEALRSYDARGSMEGWLKRVTARMALTAIRKRARHAESPLSDAPEMASGGQLPDGAVERTMLERALGRIPEDLRLVFLLKEAEGYSHDEVAALLGIRPGTSEVRLHRAKKQLRTLLRSER